MARRAKQGQRDRRSIRRSSGHQVFVSHATADKWLAVTLCEKIEATGATTFRDDRDIQGGDIIPREIFRQIRASQEFLVLLTPVSITRQWIMFELGAARLDDKRIVPILYQVSTEQIPAIIQQNKGFALNDVDQYFAELANRVKGLR